MFDPGLFIHPGKGRFNPRAPTVLFLELCGVLPGPPGGVPQGLEAKAKIMTVSGGEKDARNGAGGYAGIEGGGFFMRGDFPPLFQLPVFCL